MSEERFDRLEQRLDGLDRQMRVVHEDVIDRIAAIPERVGPTREEFGELRDLMIRRFDTLEAVVRQHNVQIAQLKQARG